MRAGAISDEMWDLYLSRVLQPDDQRLLQSPFSDNPIHFVVHRHKIRVTRSMENAIAQSRRLQTPLYIIQAKDEVVHIEDERKMNAAVFSDLLKRVRPDATKGLPSFLPLYRGMRLILSTKDCVRLGVMKGCPVILENIIFADEEILPFVTLAGEPHHLSFMPICLVLRAENVPWTLPATELPLKLPVGIDRRGLFLLRPAHDYLRVPIADEYVSIRRTSFLLAPADTMTVYAAQGGTYSAVVADMKRPPGMDLAIHWLACYVMLSRSRSIEGLLILRAADRKELSSRPPKELLDEIDRLLALEAKSHKELVACLKSMDLHLPPEILRILSDDAVKNEDAEVRRARAQKANGPSSCENAVAPRPQKRMRLKSKTAPLIDGRTFTKVEPIAKKLKANSSLQPDTTMPSAAEECGSREQESATSDGTDEVGSALAMAAVGLLGLPLVASMSDSKSDPANAEMNADSTADDIDIKSESASFGANVRAPTSDDPSIALRNKTCSLECHICGPADFDRPDSCSSCGLTCHTNCTDLLCRFEVCEICMSHELITHKDSEHCRDLQRYNMGCHNECGRPGCIASAIDCHAKCKRHAHVCTCTCLQVICKCKKCSSCDKFCHEDNNDPRCNFHGKARGVVAWNADADDLVDTQAGTQGQSRHRSQVSWYFKKDSNGQKTGTIVVDNVSYFKGYGRPSDHPEEMNNCLIDSLRQTLHLECDRMRVRADLVAKFGNCDPHGDVEERRRRVTQGSYLDIASHWRAILESLFLHDTSGRVISHNLDDYCVIALYGTQEGHGAVEGNLRRAKHRLVIVNTEDRHFDPCLPL